MKYWICTYTSTNDQGLGVGVVTKSEEEPRTEWENVEWKEISEDDYNNCLDPVNSSRFINSILDKKELHKKLRELLPIYMIPGALHSITEFPLTKNGKVDRKLLLERRRQK